MFASKISLCAIVGSGQASGITTEKVADVNSFMMEIVTQEEINLILKWNAAGSVRALGM